MTRTLKLSDETYERLNRLAGRIRAEEGRPVSLDRAIERLLDGAATANPLDFAGGWQMDDDEAAAFEATLRRMWSTWRIES